jgi:NADH-quinone oxidoreductase subunit N
MPPMFVAQMPAEVAVPEVAWSSFAPELAPTAGALVLLLLVVAGRHRMVVAVPTAALAFAVGGWLVTMGLVVPGAVTIALGAAAPALVLAFSERPSLIPAWGSGLSLVGALALTLWQYAEVLAPAGGAIQPTTTLGGAVASDGIAFFTRLTVYLVGLLVVPIGYGYLRDRGIHRGEVEPLLLLAVVGMTFLGTANDLITLFVALEILSIALFVLTGLARRDRRSQEASLKYFITGVVASTILLYGMALLYVATGSLSIPAIGASIGLVTAPTVIPVAGLALVTVGVGFKVALAPFHLWAPDVYQGAPTNITALMATATKAAGFAALLRLYLVAFPSLEWLWVPTLAVLAAGTMLYGAYLALVQGDLKRMLAYSSITHAGYATIGVASNTAAGLSATLWYLLTYGVASVAAFGCVIAVERTRRGEVTLSSLRGLGRTSPSVAGILGLSLLSLAGIPLTAGFVGKLEVFRAGVAAGLTWLVVLGVLSSVVAAFFYLRIAGMMFLEEPDVAPAVPVLSSGLTAGVAVSGVMIIYLGVQPQVFLQLAENAAALVR